MRQTMPQLRTSIRNLLNMRANYPVREQRERLEAEGYFDSYDRIALSECREWAAWYPDSWRASANKKLRDKAFRTALLLNGGIPTLPSQYATTFPSYLAKGG